MDPYGSGATAFLVYEMLKKTLGHKKALLLDMNGTFMFDEDRFGEDEDYSVHYRELGGVILTDEINKIIRAAYEYLDVRYLDEAYQNQFPTLESAIRETCGRDLDSTEMDRVVATFAYHECGYIPDEYVSVLRKLQKDFILATVIDIWAPKSVWLDLFKHLQITELFSAMFFSSDHGIVKPSPRPFEIVLSEIKINPSEAIMIGDSPRRDLGGAMRAGVECILVGGAKHPDAMMCLENLLEFSNLL